MAIEMIVQGNGSPCAIQMRERHTNCQLGKDNGTRLHALHATAATNTCASASKVHALKLRCFTCSFVHFHPLLLALLSPFICVRVLGLLGRRTTESRHVVFICFIAQRISEQASQMTTCGKHVTIMSEGDWTQVRPMSLPTMKAK